MNLKLDLHVHTTRSGDALTRIDEIPRICRLRGIDGVALTDHDQPVIDLPSGIPAIPGIEISSKDGHVIGLGVTAHLSRGMTADDTIDEIQRLGGIAIVPHPYDVWRHSVSPERLASRPDAIEVINSSSFLHSVTWKKARKFSARNRVPAVAGSDSHIPQTLGRAFTVIETKSNDLESVLDAIRNGSVLPEGRPITLGDRIRKLKLQAF